jgi:anaerobic ribonucleoside-triphosphate reductase activating protein
LKYVNTGVVFQEIPDEVTLSINISNCPCHCMGCHSQYLWEDIGEPLNAMSLDVMLKEYGDDITCVAFMGGDATPDKVDSLAGWMHGAYPHLKTAWYSGRAILSDKIHLKNFDYIKLGPYIEAKGPLNKPTTNQILYKVNPKAENGIGEDITKKFWKK